jgi:hypothetical protein
MMADHRVGRGEMKLELRQILQSTALFIARIIDCTPLYQPAHR